LNEKLKVIISAEVDKLKQGVQEAQRAMNDFRSDTDKVSKAVDANMKSMGTAAANGMKTLGTAIAAGGAAMLGLAASTQEVQANQAKLVSAFESAGSSAAQASETYTGLYRVLGDDGQAVEAAQHLSQLTTNQQDLSEWTNICQGVYATFGASLPIESLTEAANETAKTGQLTGALADAINWAGISEEEFQAKLDACNTEAEREALIRETLSGVYDEAAAKYEENAGALMDQQEAQAKLNVALAKFGAAMAPVLTALMNFASTALEQVVPVLQELAEKYGPALSDAFSAAGEAVGKAFGFFVDNWGIIAAIAGVIAGIAAAIGLYNAVAAVKAAMDALQVTSLTALIAAQWAQATATMAALAPYLLIVAAIAAVIAIIVLCVKHWDEIKAKVIEVAGKIKDSIKEMGEKVGQLFEALKEKISQVVENIKTAVSNKFQAIKDGIAEKVQAAKETVTNIFEGIKSAIQSKVDAAKNGVSNTFNNIKSTISNTLNAAKSTVTSIFDSIKSGIQSKINAARDGVKSAIDKIKSFFNFSWSLPKIKLPHFSISGKFSLNPPSIPSFSVSWYKMGGVFDNPTLFPYGNGRIGGLGEAGAEAVVPLEKNTKWLDKIAEKLGAGQSAQIILQVDGKTFAQTAVTSINNLTRQQGKLSLNLA
jgi:phage-related protein